MSYFFRFLMLRQLANFFVQLTTTAVIRLRVFVKRMNCKYYAHFLCPSKFNNLPTGTVFIPIMFITKLFTVFSIDVWMFVCSTIRMSRVLD